VAFLVPVSIIIGFIFAEKKQNKDAGERKVSLKSLPIPWFIVGFLAMSAIYTTGVLPTFVSDALVAIAYLLIGMAMAGLGLNVDLNSFKQYGLKSFKAGLIGTVLLAGVGAGLVWMVV